ncbi:MAG: acetyl-CoA decarbonylase/synthase complex subunit gamma [Methanomassiliicoccales archaeon]|nr:acetyl-CoA decarbonylase/synthase complex subunit gamma [Methanomassiliicoccales archaeon]
MPTAIEIFKHLPKKNCGECKNPTCLAFAMQLANNKAKLDDCPYLSDAGRNALASSSAPPIRLVRVGSGKNVVDMGDETELYRHDKRFFHPTALALRVNDMMSADELGKKLGHARSLRFERVGQVLKLDMIEAECRSGDATKFASFVQSVASMTDWPLVLRCKDASIMNAAVAVVKDRRPLLHGADESNVKEMAAVAKGASCPLVLCSADLGRLADLVEMARKEGVEDLVLDPMPATMKESLERCTVIRRSAIRKTFRGLGFPIYLSTPATQEGTLMALTAVMKYGSLLSFDELPSAQALPLMVLRQNIYTDPQVPIQVKADLYPVNNPGPDAPILFTTNFSLTYFTVLSDIEKSKVPVWLQVIDTEGLSVLTSYSAGKLTAEAVQKALLASNAKERTTKGVLIIPGMVARMSVKLNEATGLKIVVGPKESSGIPKFLRSMNG